MDFENVNVNVTRKSFGSRVDKEFQREGVVPIKDRSKANEYDYAAESAKYNELNKKVETRRLTDVKESRAFNIALQEGYNKVRDVLIKDFMSEIVVESLLVDKEVVDNNLKSIVMLVEEQVDAIGGYNGIKEIAESTGNQLLNNIIAACEAVCAKVGKRNLQESEGKASKLDFGINRDEFEEYNYLKQSNGSETIIDIVKDKVYNVIKDEQETNAKNQAVMNEIESKIKELEVPVNEAMDAIFNKVGIEESSLFNSLMRSHYAQLLETNSSAIFEADTIDDETIDAFEDEEFKMSEIELLGNDGEGEDPMDDDSEDEIVEEASIQKKARKYKDAKLAKKIVKKEEEIARVKARLAMEKDEDYRADMKEDIQILQQELKVLKNEYAHRDRQSKIKTNFYAKEAGEMIDIMTNGTVEQLSEALDNFAMEIETEAASCRTKSSAKKCKEAVREIQNTSEEIVEEGIAFDGARELLEKNKYADVRKTSNIDLVNSKPKAEDTEEEVCKDKACESTKPSVSDIFALMEARCGGKKVKEEVENPDVSPSVNNEKPVKEEVEEPLDEEIILCPVCGEEDCVCDTVTEGLTTIVKKLEKNLEILLKDKLGLKTREEMNAEAKIAFEVKRAKHELENAKKVLNTAFDDIKSKKQAGYFIEDIKDLIEFYKNKAKNDHNKERAKLILDYSKWLDDYQKSIAEKAVTLESYEITTEGLSMTRFKSNMKVFFEKLLSRKLAKRDFSQARHNLKEILSVTDRIEDLNVLEADAKVAVQQLEKAKTYYPDAKDKLDDQINWIKNEYTSMLKSVREKLEKKTVVESFIDRLDNSCDILSNVIETHEVALNGVLESMTYEIDDKLRVVPYIQPNDCNLSNLEFAYKAKLVCESLKEGAMHIASEADTDIVTRAIELNVNSINESLAAIQGIDKLNYKAKMLESCKQYLGRVQNVLDNGVVPNEALTESTALFNSVEDVDRIFNQVKEYTLIESTNNDLMELVMAEAIVEYTIMEAFNTLNLVNYNKDSVRQMARRNISK